MSGIHIVTLWCALIAKIQKGINRCIPASLSPLQYRVLLQLCLPETEEASVNRLAFALAVRPSDVEAALDTLIIKGLIDVDDNAHTHRINSEGRQIAQMISAEIRLFVDKGLEELGPVERELINEVLWDNLSIPGSFFVQCASSAIKGCRLPLVYEITSYSMIKTALDYAIKRNANLSFTSFRFLLELHPKRNGAEKLLRFKDIASMLRVGRSYISTEAVKLEERELIKRVPDPDDARGVLYELTPLGQGLVRTTTDDLLTIYSGVFTMHGTEIGLMRNLMKSLVAGFDKALEA